MRKLFGRKAPDPTSIVSERWESRFHRKHRARFQEERTADYEAHFDHRELMLTLKRRNLFAWVNDPLYRYRDLVLEAELRFPTGSPYCAGGLLFRYVNESTYYYFLVSTRGFYRFDVVFNGNPICLIDWTALPSEEGAPASSASSAEQSAVASSTPVRLLVIANGTRFTLCYNDVWIAELDDDTIDAGGVAFGAQNYDEQDQAQVSLQRILVDSVGMDVEAYHYRWREGIPVDPETRLRLATTLFASGNSSAAMIQIRKSLKSKRADFDTLFLLAECQVNLGLHETALENIEGALTMDPNRQEAQQEKANLLYLLGRYLQLRDYLRDRVAGAESSTAWNLYGHAQYSLGNWDGAAAAYEKACELESEMPFFHVNAARAYEHLDRRDDALRHYLVAGRLFVRQDALKALEEIIPAMKALDPENAQGRAFQATVAFHAGNLPAAEELFDALVSEGFEDSAALYMLGIIRNRAGDRKGAVALFGRAAASEPEFPLYWFRLAETLYLIGDDPSDALDRALSLDPEDAWILNLAGQVWLAEGRISEALEALAKASRIAPHEPDITANYAEALFHRGEVEEAIGLLAKNESAQSLNILGNIYSRLSRPSDAMAAYERAYALDPDDSVVMENLAAACIECDEVRRAEELLGRLVEKAPSASVLNRVGNLSQIEGDLVRAEAAYRQALEYLGLPDIDHPLSSDEIARVSADSALNQVTTEIEANLAGLYLQWFRYDKARATVERLELHSSTDRVRALRSRVRSATEVRLSCAACGREWWAPKIVEAPSRVVLHGEPPVDSPAGRCERCGKVYCIGCAVEHLRGNRFVCPDCDEFLKLNDDHLKYLALRAVEISRNQ